MNSLIKKSSTPRGGVRQLLASAELLIGTASGKKTGGSTREISSDVLKSILHGNGSGGGGDSSAQTPTSTHHRRQNYSLAGVFPSISTPFKRLKNEAISYEKLEQNLIKWSRIPFSGYSLFGYYGEYPYLTQEERTEIIKVVRQMIGRSKPIIVGSSSESLKKTLEICESMKKAGADYSIIFTPHYYKKQMTYMALLEYFTRVADLSPLPILLHNIPSVTFIDLPADLIIDLSAHPNIVGFKECSHNIAKIACICDHVKMKQNCDFSVLTGSSSFILDAVHVGAVGTISVLACVLGESIVDLYNMARDEVNFREQQRAHFDEILNAKFTDRSQELQNRLIGPDLAISENFGIPGLKAALDSFGYFGGACRLPLLDLNEHETQALKDIFDSSGFGWPDVHKLKLAAAENKTSSKSST